MLDLLIIGAGPYGISLAAHAAAKGLSYRLLGYPMDFWKNQMPQNMFIRTPHDFVSLSDPEGKLTIHRFAEETLTLLETPLPRPVFVEYVNWFAEQAGVTFTPELVTSLEQLPDGEGFRATTEIGRDFTARRAIIATGVEHDKHIPEVLQHLLPRLLSHTSGYTDFSAFRGQKVAVLGSGQSAWEAAALLHRAGADTELIYRRDQPNYSGSREAEIALQELGDNFYHLPLDQKRDQWGQAPGSIAHFLRPYVEGIVPQTARTSVASAAVTPDGQVSLQLTDGTERIVDHVISASGFRIHLDHVPFLPESLKQAITREPDYTQFPQLNEHFESNIPGLYFAGPLSSHSHGPTFRFILGLKKTAESIFLSINQQEPITQ